MVIYKLKEKNEAKVRLCIFSLSQYHEDFDLGARVKNPFLQNKSKPLSMCCHDNKGDNT